MNILITGSGGREHALGWALAGADARHKMYGLPGNPGIAELGRTLAGDPCDPATVLAAVEEMRIDLVVIGPEAPLVAGVANALRSAGVRVFGPTAEAAELEGSKVFAKDLLRRHKIPTAGFTVAETAAEALTLAERISYPHVLKADGLASGKGALIVQDREEAQAAIQQLMVDQQFGAAGKRVVFEEFMEGEEISVFAVAAGEHYILLPPSQDYKRALDGDRGLNTGGMGAYAPVVTWNDDLALRVRREIIEPTLHAMACEGRPYTGLLYAGLMVKDNEPRVVEYNCRFGDPEAQVVLPILQGDLLELLWEASDRAAGARALPESCGHDGRSAVCVVIASQGYPGSVETGYPIRGLAGARAVPDALVFHAGTKLADGHLVTKGGRVLNVVGIGEGLAEARDVVYEAAAAIEFQGAFHRRDIGWRGMKALESLSK